MKKSVELAGSKSLLQNDSLAARIEQYENTALCNEAIYCEFTSRTDTIPFLKTHRDWVEKNEWGFGDRAFHYMWLLILDHICAAARPRFLEIGVYKGQVLSLVALCGEQLGRSVDLYAISPFEGSRSRSRVLHAVLKRIQPKYRDSLKAGNLYERRDYLADCKEIFAKFDQNFNAVTVLQGLSSDVEIYKQVRDTSFQAVYIDGDHSFDAVSSDLIKYGALVAVGGFLVMDDASCDIPGEGYFKGHPAVSKAAAIVPSLGFKNVLNCGHNRVFMRIA